MYGYYYPGSKIYLKVAFRLRQFAYRGVGLGHAPPSDLAVNGPSKVEVLLRVVGIVVVLVVVVVVTVVVVAHLAAQPEALQSVG